MYRKCIANELSNSRGTWTDMDIEITPDCRQAHKPCRKKGCDSHRKWHSPTGKQGVRGEVNGLVIKGKQWHIYDM